MRRHDDVSDGDIDWARLLGGLAVLGATWYWRRGTAGVDSTWQLAAIGAWMLGARDMLIASMAQIKSQLDASFGVEFMPNATAGGKVASVLAPLGHLLDLHTDDISLLGLDIGAVFVRIGLSARLGATLSMLVAVVLVLACARLLWAQQVCLEPSLFSQ